MRLVNGSRSFLPNLGSNGVKAPNYKRNNKFNSLLRYNFYIISHTFKEIIINLSILLASPVISGTFGGFVNIRFCHKKFL